VTGRRIAATLTLVAALGVGAAACRSSSDDTSGATNLDEVGPDLAKLRAEVTQLRREVRSLRQEVARLSPTTTAPLR
jgi:hypothetical protein